MTPLLDTDEASSITKQSPRTLERHRVAGTGPRFIRLGRSIRYREADLEDWIAKRTVQSTSEMEARS
jgi:predicted DNA-binding transcriptional regulator AlpA